MSDDLSKFNVFGIQIKIDHITQAYNTGIVELTTKLEEMMVDIPVWACTHLFETAYVDSMTKDTPGYSFLDSAPIQVIIITRIQAKMSFKGWLLLDSGDNNTPHPTTNTPPHLCWNPVKARGLMEQSREIQFLFIVLFHLGIGQPTKGSELTTLLLHNI